MGGWVGRYIRAVKVDRKQIAGRLGLQSEIGTNSAGVGQERIFLQRATSSGMLLLRFAADGRCKVRHVAVAVYDRCNSRHVAVWGPLRVRPCHRPCPSPCPCRCACPSRGPCPSGRSSGERSCQDSEAGGCAGHRTPSICNIKLTIALPTFAPTLTSLLTHTGPSNAPPPHPHPTHPWMPRHKHLPYTDGANIRVVRTHG